MTFPPRLAAELAGLIPISKARFREQLWRLFDSNGPVALFYEEEMAGFMDFHLLPPTAENQNRVPDHKSQSFVFAEYGATVIGAATLPVRLPKESRTTKRTVYSPG